MAHSVPRSAQSSPWLVYLLRCSDRTLYTGATNNLPRRLAAHRHGRVKYTRGRLPVAVVYIERVSGHGAALVREAALKRLSRQAKEALVSATELPGQSQGR